MNNTIVIGGELSLSNEVKGEISLTTVMDGAVGTFYPLYPNAYQGEYTITPSSEVQTIPIVGLMASRNIIINPVPSNYGLITWNGSTLTVS